MPLPSSSNGDPAKEMAPTDANEGVKRLHAELLAEHKFVSDEILATIAHTYTTVNFVLAASAIMAASTALGANNALPRSVNFMIASFVTLGGFHILIAHLERIWRNALYLQLRTELVLPGIAWERSLEARRNKTESEQNLIHPHFVALQCFNVGLAFGMIADRLALGTERLGWFLCNLSFSLLLSSWLDWLVIIPIAVFLWSRHKLGAYGRGGSYYKKQCAIWSEVLEHPELGTAAVHARLGAAVQSS